MLSAIDRKVVYPVSTDITEHDIDVVSDLWNMDGHEVYRGRRDPTYKHANVYWLYDEDLDRVGLAEHDLIDHADVHLRWYYESPFATLLQEKGWEVGDSIWSVLPESVYERFTSEGWTTPKSILEQCLKSSVRVFSPDMVLNPPKMYSCEKCAWASLEPLHAGCIGSHLDVHNLSKVFFVDESLTLHKPPSGSKVFTLLQPPPHASAQASLLEPQPQPHTEAAPRE